MMRPCYLLFFFIILCFHSTAQLPLDRKKFADSLNHILQQSNNDSIKALANYHLVYHWLNIDSASAKQYLLDGRKLSAKSPYLTAMSYAHEGYFYYATNMAKSEVLYRKAEQMLSKFHTKEAYIHRSNIWTAIAAMQQRKDDDKGYINIVLSKIIPLALQAKDSILVGQQYSGLGVAFMNTEQYDKAAVYFNKALQLLKKLKATPSRLVAVYNRAAENYMLLHQYAKTRAILDTVKTILEPYPDSELYAVHYMVEGLYFQQFRQYKQALDAYDKGVKAANGPNKPFLIQEILLNKVKSLIGNKNYTEAIQLTNTLTKDESVMEIDKTRLELYAGLAESYAGLGKMNQAYLWQKRYSDLGDSVAHQQLDKDVNALEIKYKNAEKEKEISALKAKNTEAALSAKNNKLINWLLGSASITLLIVAIFSLLYYRNNKKLLIQQEKSYQQHLKDIEQQQQLRFSQAMLQGEEQERRRLARDLHDGLGGMLAGVKINLSGQLESPSSEDHRNNLQKVIGQLDNSVTELRRIAHNMMPVNLLNFGLKTALKDLCETLMTKTTRIDFQAFEISNNIPEQTQINIYRIVQEMLANALRHADATNIILQCSQNGNTFFITQEDNGKGFDMHAENIESGIGLSNIRNRVGFLKGKIEIESAINAGTVINIELNVD